MNNRLMGHTRVAVLIAEAEPSSYRNGNESAGKNDSACSACVSASRQLQQRFRYSSPSRGQHGKGPRKTVRPGALCSNSRFPLRPDPSTVSWATVPQPLLGRTAMKQLVTVLAVALLVAADKPKDEAGKKE